MTESKAIHQILVLDNDKDFVSLLQKELGPDGFEIIAMDPESDSLSTSDLFQAELIFIAVESPDMLGYSLYDKARKKVDDPFKSLDKLESLSGKERWEFWKEQLSKCIRCYACRSACPMCYCDECVVDTINFAVTADTSAEEKAGKIKWI